MNHTAENQKYFKRVHIANVELNVKSITHVKAFYIDIVGLEIVSESTNTLTLGYNNQPLLTLTQSEGLTENREEQIGLYHTAFLYSSKKSLIEVLKKAIKNFQHLYQGSADHLVSEAFYFSDPEGNGVELYYDKPDGEWIMNSEGKPVMGSEYIDLNQYINQHLEEEYNISTVSIGHIHLKVSDIKNSEEFYLDQLGFDSIANIGSALFVSVDGYHHHIGMNTWHTSGIKPNLKPIYGLSSFEIVYSEDRPDNSIYDPSGINIKIRNFREK